MSICVEALRTRPRCALQQSVERRCRIPRVCTLKYFHAPIRTTRRDARRIVDSAFCVLLDCYRHAGEQKDRKSTRLNSSHPSISYAVFCLKKKTQKSHS